MDTRNGENDDTFGFSSMRIKDTRTLSQKFKQFIYNPEKHQILGKTKKEWGVKFLFYMAFYAVLALLCAVCIGTLCYFLDENKPRWTLTDSLIGASPGVVYRPNKDFDKTFSITYNASIDEEVEVWTKRVDRFLEPYVKNQTQVCNFNGTWNFDVPCAVVVNKSAFGNCAYSTGYGYKDASPCIYLKLNKVYNWVPEYYDDVDNLPKEMPLDLKTHIKNRKKEERKYVWVSCQRSDENGTFEYHPKEQGFAHFYYPYKNVHGYLSPLVAMQIIRPKKGQVIKVECRVWAKNIPYEPAKNSGKGATYFNLLIN